MAMQLCREIQRSFIQQIFTGFSKYLLGTFSNVSLLTEYREQEAAPPLWGKHKWGRGKERTVDEIQTSACVLGTAGPRKSKGMIK